MWDESFAPYKKTYDDFVNIVTILLLAIPVICLVCFVSDIIYKKCLQFKEKRFLKKMDELEKAGVYTLPVNSDIQMTDSYRLLKNSQPTTSNQSSQRNSVNVLDLVKTESHFVKHGVSMFDRRQENITWDFRYIDGKTMLPLYEDWQDEFNWLFT